MPLLKQSQFIAYANNISNELCKISASKQKTKDHSLLSDFIAGVDPTGTMTYSLASKAQKNHSLHKFVGGTGGFIGGAAIGAAIPAAMLGLSALALRHGGSHLHSDVLSAAKGAADVLNPGRMLRHIKSISVKDLRSLRKIQNMPKASKDMIMGRTMAALTTIPPAIASGALNATSTNLQYNEALRQRGLREKG